MADKLSISAADVLGFLASRQPTAPDAAKAARKKRAYLHAAAVLSAIQDIRKLKPVGVTGATGEAAQLLADEIIPAPGSKHSGALMLSGPARTRALRELGTRKAMLAALAVNTSERRTADALESCIRGKVKPLEKQTIDELTATLQALVWLNGILPNMPSLDDVRERLDYLRLLAPFEALASDAVFQGRVDELDQLRRYVGVLPPESLLQRLLQRTLEWQKPVVQPALTVFGPGGIGKSALVARFMLEHTRLPEELRVPFAYLDCDRAALDISDPLTMSAEMVRQAQLQFPAYFRTLHEFAVERVAPIEDRAQLDARMNERVGSAISLLADLVGILRGSLAARPYVVVLDSFEEAQYRGEERAHPFWNVLTELQRRAPFLRVVISGRAPVTSLRLAGEPALELEVGALDDDAAQAFMKAQGVADAHLAQRLVKQVGGVPLSMKLVASLVKREADRAYQRPGWRGTRLWFSVTDAVIQGQLYERILGHIHDPRVERLAYPGLVLRRLTAEVILRVLNEPCQLGIQSAADAQALFEELSRETALVASVLDDESSEPVLVHRPDLRRVMLNLLLQKEPALVERIHRSAIAWYRQSTTRRAQAEMAYHQLQLGELPDRKLLDHPDIRFSLQASLVELPVQMQLALVSYGYRVDADTLARASADQREAGIAERVEKLIPYGRSLKEAESLLQESGIDKLTRPSPLFLSAARVAAERGENPSASRWLEKGLVLATESNDTRLVLRLLGEKCWLQRNSTDRAGHLRLLERLEEFATRHQESGFLLQQRLQLYDAKSRSSVNARQRDASMRQQIVELLPGLGSRGLWDLMPALAKVLPALIDSLPHSDKREPLIDCLVPLIAEDDGPIRNVVWQSKAASSAAEDLLALVLPQRLDESAVAHAFARAFEELAESWAYRVLRVQPPYSRGAANLKEML